MTCTVKDRSWAIVLCIGSECVKPTYKVESQPKVSKALAQFYTFLKSIKFPELALFGLLYCGISERNIVHSLHCKDKASTLSLPANVLDFALFA